MLVQNPSRIFKADFSVWRKENSCIINEIIDEEKTEHLRKVSEIVLNENGIHQLKYKKNTTILVLVLYGEILINDFGKPISSEKIFILKSTEDDFLKIKNNLYNEKADVLIIELKSNSSENSFFIEDLNIAEKNILVPISKNIAFPNFIGLYEGRKQKLYPLYRNGSTVFGMVINGAFEFQNRLMETRDAILLTELETLEFEALSENALLLFLEV